MKSEKRYLKLTKFITAGILALLLAGCPLDDSDDDPVSDGGGGGGGGATTMSLRLNNNTAAQSITVVYVWLASSGTSPSGGDQLSSTLNPGGNWTLNSIPFCDQNFYFRAQSAGFFWTNVGVSTYNIPCGATQTVNLNDA